MITIMYKKPNEEPTELSIEPNLETYQKLVGGNIEHYRFSKSYNISCYINEEGKLKGLESNVYVPHDVLVGNIVFFAPNGENENSLTQLQKDFINAYCDIYETRKKEPEPEYKIVMRCSTCDKEMNVTNTLSKQEREKWISYYNVKVPEQDRNIKYSNFSNDNIAVTITIPTESCPYCTNLCEVATIVA